MNRYVLKTSMFSTFNSILQTTSALYHFGPLAKLGFLHELKNLGRLNGVIA